MESKNTLELPYENRFSRGKLFEFIVFLPFNDTWKMFIILGVAFMYIYIAYGMFIETPTFIMKANWLNRLFDIPYSIDFITSLVHWKATSWRSRRIHKPRKAVYIVIDILTLAPFSLFIDVPEDTWSYKGYFIYGIRCLRIYRIFLYSSK